MKERALVSFLRLRWRLNPQIIEYDVNVYIDSRNVMNDMDKFDS